MFSMTKVMISLPTSLLIFLAIEWMDMGKDTTAFRERFNAYKNGKSVSEIYDAGLPRYSDGTQSTADFLKNYEGFRSEVYLDGKGIKTIGYGFTDPSLVNKGVISVRDADAELKRQIAARQAKLRLILGPDKWDKLSNDSKTALTSYHFNYPAGFSNNTRFMKAWRAGNYGEAIRQVDAGMNDEANRGLRDRRLAELALLRKDPFLMQSILPPKNVTPKPIIEQSVSTSVRPVIPIEQTVPIYDTKISPYISGKPTVKLMPRIQLPNLMEVMEDSEWEPLFPGLKDGKLPVYKDGKIYIKPANRGKFTALKKRTGHSASWFKENGTSAQKKMAVFELNSKHWNH